MESKWIAKSLTLWGALVTAASALAPVLGLDIAPEGWAEIGDSGASAINALGVAVGSIMTIVGRFKASTKVTALPTKPAAPTKP